jgi:hypothetical protein
VKPEHVDVVADVAENRRRRRAHDVYEASDEARTSDSPG